MYTKEELEEKWSSIKFESSFEPTLNPFKNGLLVNYKKVGTRYMGQLISIPSDVSDNKIQMDLIVTKHRKSINKITLDSENYMINYHHDLKFCYTEFDKHELDDYQKNTQTYLNYSNSIEFLKYCEVTNYNELFFKNKKDIIFLVRNPIHRFFSGVIQILHMILFDIEINKNILQEINFYTGLDVDDLKNVQKIISEPDITENILFNLKKNEIQLLISFLIEKQWNLIFQDIHTQNYLFNYVEWIYNIKDKSKIKIIDLKDCRSNKSLDFFTNLIGNELLKTKYPHDSTSKTYWEWLSNQTGTNKPIYNLFLDKLINSDLKLETSSMYYYLKDEYELYDSLINSPYFVDLKD